MSTLTLCSVYGFWDDFAFVVHSFVLVCFFTHFAYDDDLFSPTRVCLCVRSLGFCLGSLSLSSTSSLVLLLCIIRPLSSSYLWPFPWPYLWPRFVSSLVLVCRVVCSVLSSPTKFCLIVDWIDTKSWGGAVQTIRSMVGVLEDESFVFYHRPLNIR